MTPSNGGRGSGRGKSKSKNDGLTEDLPGADDFEDFGDGAEGKVAVIARSEIIWIRDHSDCDHERQDNIDCTEAPIKNDRNGRGMRSWIIGVGFDFCEKWDNPKRGKDDVAYKPINLFITKNRNSDYAEMRTLIEKTGWKIKDVGELEGHHFRWFSTDENVDGTPRVFESGGEEIEWMQWFAREYLPDYTG